MSSPDHGSRDLTMEALISPRVRVEDVIVAQRQTRTFESSLARSIQAESEQKVEEVAMNAEVGQQLTIEQLNLFQQREESLAAKTAEYLQQQYDNQVELNTSQAALSAQFEEQQNALAQQYQLMREAAETVGQQSRAGQSTRVADDDELMTEEGASVGRNEPAITVATGANIPVPPVYRGSTEKEKKAFMDSYLHYKRRITALNQGSYGRVFVMPLSACIEHRTLVRICMYELGKPETEITEEEWKAYFVAARRPEIQDHARLTQAMRALSMDMDDFPIDEPKVSVEFRCAALKPPALKRTVVTELKRAVHESTKKSVKVFVDKLRSRVSAFLIFESAILQTTGGGGSQAQSQPKPSNTTRSTGRFQQKGETTAGVDPKTKGGGSSGASNAQKTSAAKKPESQDRPPRKRFKCGDLTHGVFQCPLANATEDKELYDKNRKPSKPVGAIAISEAQPVSPPAEPTAAKTLGPLPCLVNQMLDAWAKPDSGAEVSVVTPRMLQEFTAQGQWLQCRDLKQWESIKGITTAPMVIKQEVKLGLRFDTVNGGLTLKNLTCWVVSGGLARGMGDILLSEGVMEHLGYNAQALLDQARNLREVYDMDEAVPTSVVRNVLSYAVATSSHIEATPEEQELQPEEEQHYFPDVGIDQDSEEARAREWSILEDKLNEASGLGCSAVLRDELAKILFQYRDVFRIQLGRDPPVDMPPLKVTLKPNATPARCKARRYPAEHRAFMKKHVKELIDARLCYRNLHSKWCSPPLVVKKVDPGDFRATVDVRRVNAQTLRLLWPMPILEVIMDYLTDSELYFLLGFFQGYWQFILSLECQELFSFLTDMGIFTPTRVLMGGTDSVAYC
ncbi:Hypothetical protein PHPALM_19656 [Phytophthora palmivora]|uniref:Reverse transcriptase n=1 Tax=Phytophthora palmivora TaxID=4796 RepID=A0A2P4XGU1_9STRA|nr:Hypothetical protein PHPALM_19656 [Phytophthora palmivora]